MSVAQDPLTLPQYLQVGDYSKEEIDLLSTLPREKGWVVDHLYLYQGFWNTSRYLQGVIACQKHFQPQDADIFLVTTPKSGTTWLKAILFALVNRVQYSPSHEHQLKLQHPLLTNNPHDLVPFLEIKLYVDKQVPDLTSLAPPRLFSTHVPYVSLPECVRDFANCKVVYLCREPKDTFISMWHFSNKLRHESKGKLSLEESLEMFCRGVSLFGSYWDHVLGYWKQSLERPETVLFIRFEEMKQQPDLHLRRLADFLGCPFSSQEETQGMVQNILQLCSFENMRNLEVNKNGKLSKGEENKAFFRRGEPGDWKNYLTAEMVKKIDSITQEKWKGSGLHF